MQKSGAILAAFILTIFGIVWELNAPKPEQVCPTQPPYFALCGQVVTVIATNAANATTSPTSGQGASPTPLPTVTPTPFAIFVTPNLFKNPGFEAPYINKLHADGFYHIVADYWTAVYCDACPAFNTGPGQGNPSWLLLGRPEYKPSSVDNDPLRIHDDNDPTTKSASAQEFFGFYRAYEGGVYQIVNTTPGATCKVTAWVQSWSGFDGDKDPHKSHLITKSDQANSNWVIRVDPTGGTEPRNFVLQSRKFGYDDGIYDAWAFIDYTFVASGPKTTVFFEDVRLWPARNNNGYLDDASLRCDK